MGHSVSHLLGCVSERETLVALLTEGSEARAELLQRVVSNPALLTKHCLPEHSTVWHVASSHGNLALLEWLVQQQEQQAAARVVAGHGALGTAPCLRVLDEGDVHGATPLMHACANDHPGIAAFLVTKGVDPYRRDLSGMTALHYAARHGNDACIKAIMDNLPANMIVQTRTRVVRVPQATGHYIWFGGLESDGAEGMLHLVQTIKLQDARDKLGLSPLHIAVGFNHTQCVEALLQHDASLTVSSKVFTTEMGFYLPAGSTPLHVAADRGNPEICRMLLKLQTSLISANHEDQRPAHVDTRLMPNKNGAIPLQVAAFRNRPTEVLQLLHPLTDLAGVFDMQELAAPASGVAKLCFIAASALQAKLLADLQLAEAAPLPAVQEAEAEASDFQRTQSAEAGNKAMFLEQASSLNNCAVCFERVPDVEVAGCDHKLCIQCARRMCKRSAGKPVTCPFCRKSIEGFHRATLAFRPIKKPCDVL